MPRQATQGTMLPAVVAWLDNNVGLELSRTLSDRGVPVIALATDANNYRCKTRYVQRVIEVADEDAGLAKALQDLRSSLPDGAVFCPTTDRLARIASENRSSLESCYRMAIGSEKSLVLLGDKAEADSLVRKAGILAPRTWNVSTIADIKTLTDSCSFPLIVKPSVRTDAWWSEIGEKAFMVDSKERLIQTLEDCLGLAPSIIVQEWIEGSDADMFFYLSYTDQNRRTLVDLVGRKIRQWPALTGVGASSVHVDEPELCGVSRRLIENTGFIGFCEIEFKRKKGTDEFYFIEANVGRPSLHSTLAESCGVEMQYIMYCDCAGIPMSEPVILRHPGAKCIVWRFELHSAIEAMRNGELSFGSWIKSLKGRKRSVDIHFRDPMVFWLGFGLVFLQSIARNVKARLS